MLSVSSEWRNTRLVVVADVGSAAGKRTAFNPYFSLIRVHARTDCCFSLSKRVGIILPIFKSCELSAESELDVGNLAVTVLCYDKLCKIADVVVLRVES